MAAVEFGGDHVPAEAAVGEQDREVEDEVARFADQHFSYADAVSFAIDQGDVLSSGIEVINVATAGFLTKADGATTKVSPILHTSAQAMEVPVQNVGQQADPIALLRNYKTGDKELVLAARISGETKSAFSDGAPKADEKKEEPAKDAKAGEAPAADAKKDEAAAAPGPNHVASGRINPSRR